MVKKQLKIEQYWSKIVIMNDEIKKTPGHLSLDDIRNGCIVLAGEENKEEQKLCMIKEEFRNGIDNIKNTTPSVTFYGSARIKEDHPVYQVVKNLAYRISKELNYAVITGGGPGVMEAANHGSHDAGGRSLGLTISLPHEQHTNPYVTDEIPFEFFFARQVSMSYATEVCIFCPGGFGTFYELFEILTNMQTGKIGSVPIILYGSEFWNPLDKVIKEILLEKYQTVSDNDRSLYTIMDDDDAILEIVKNSKIRSGNDSLK
ncbi:MAG: TIGR00730 family Rossman fold protein [Candidatus Nomurabacteria bacterium]|nr:TIGR00730 family Rossman fold protein [Candidatus Nomurabacteria bacterium]